MLLAEKVASSIEVFECLAAHLLDVGVLVSYSDNPELTALLAVHIDVLLVGLVPRVVAAMSLLCIMKLLMFLVRLMHLGGKRLHLGAVGLT